MPRWQAAAIRPGPAPSVVTVLHRSNGQLITEIPIAGEQLAFEHALSGIAVDAAGDVFVVSTQLGVIRIHRHGNRYQQSAYAPPLPDLPACAPGGPQPCAPTPIDLPPLSNELAFDAAGNLYVTDSLQATIFRILAGGGAIAPWFSSPLLAGNLGAPLPFGANGLRSRITAANGSPIPLDNPAVMAFDDARESILPVAWAARSWRQGDQPRHLRRPGALRRAADLRRRARRGWPRRRR